AKFEAGRADEAEKLHREALVTQVRLVQQCPGVVAYVFWHCLMGRSLGRALSELGEQTEALERPRSALDRAEGLAKNDPALTGIRPFLGMAYRDLAQALGRAGDTAAADQARRKAETYDDRPPNGKRPNER